MTTSAFEPDLSLWDAWHPAQAAEYLAGADVPWYVAAGWALDLFRGEQTRDHDDLDVAVPSDRFDAVRQALSDFELFVVGGGLARPLTKRSLAAHHQTWVREPATGKWRVDVMREPWEGETWVFRRDPRIRLPAADAIARTESGIPYAQPEIVLLFKAKAAREKDEADFASVLPLLDSARRQWLADALRLSHPGHRWLHVLGS